jgi:uncharacterized protein
VIRVVGFIVGLAVFAYVGFCVLLFVEQRSILYYPQPRQYRDGVTLLTLRVDGENALVSSLPRDGDRALIYFGGNAEDVSLDMPELETAFPRASIYLLHYPGYGGSSGRPAEKSIVASALGLFDLVYGQHRNVVVVGRSLGSGVAVQVASQRPVARLVLVTPFDGLGDVAANQYPLIPVKLLLRDRYESWRYAPSVTAPTLILVAGNDELVPAASSERLKTRFKNGIVQYKVIPGVGHNTISEAPNYMEIIQGG